MNFGKCRREVLQSQVLAVGEGEDESKSPNASGLCCERMKDNPLINNPISLRQLDGRDVDLNQIYAST